MIAPNQMGFSFLAEIEQANERAEFQRQYGHLPATMPEGLIVYREMLDRHDAAMMLGDVEGTMSIREEAHSLAVRLNGGKLGILAGLEAPGRVLERETAAPDGTVPKWGQTGSFEITAGKMRVRIQQHGVFGICAAHLYWPGFAAHAIDRDKPFLSETGYRSFLNAGLSADGKVASGVGPDGVASEVIFQHVARELKGKLRSIVPFEPRPRRAVEAQP